MSITEAVATEETPVRTLLFGGSGGEDTTAAFEQSFSAVATAEGSGRRLGLLSPAGRTLVRGELSKVAGHLLDLPAGDAWRRARATHRRLTAAARHTLAAPGAEPAVEPEPDRATSSHPPTAL